MSLKQLKKEELFTAAEFFGTEVEGDATKDELLAALAEDGIDWAQYKKFLVPDEEPDADPEVAEPVVAVVEPVVVEVPEEKKVLVKMDRKNPIYEIGRYRFTRKHPFQLVDEKDVDRVVRRHHGFSIATPTEAREYYS